VCFPYTIYLVLKSLFSDTGQDRLKNESFELVKDDPRVLRALGGDLYSKSVAHFAQFTDDHGDERCQVIYELVGSKGEGRVDVEHRQENGAWRMQYVIVTTPFTTIRIVDNRPLMERI
jgi:hypothetical protein